VSNEPSFLKRLRAQNAGTLDPRSEEEIQSLKRASPKDANLDIQRQDLETNAHVIETGEDAPQIVELPSKRRDRADNVPDEVNASARDIKKKDGKARQAPNVNFGVRSKKPRLDPKKNADDGKPDAGKKKRKAVLSFDDDH
jgi:hypothetical protein